jgi:hypothetical protein
MPRPSPRRIVAGRWVALISLTRVASASPRCAHAQSRAASTPITDPVTIPTTNVGSPFAGLTLSVAQQTELRALARATQQARSAILQRQVAGHPMSAADQAGLTRLAAAHNGAVREVLTLGQRGAFDANVERLGHVLQRNRDARRHTTPTEGGR